MRLHTFRTSLSARDKRARTLADRLTWFMVLRAKRMSPSRVVLELLLGVSVLVAFVGPIVFFGFVGPLALLGVLVATPAAMNYFTRETGERKYRREMAASYVGEGICASCGYSLKGLPDEDDARVTCPECGAGWKAERIVAPIWDEDAPVLPRGPVAPMRWLRWEESAAARTTGDAQGRLVPITDIRLSLWSPEQREAIGPERLAHAPGPAGACRDGPRAGDRRAHAPGRSLWQPLRVARARRARDHARWTLPDLRRGARPRATDHQLARRVRHVRRDVERLDDPVLGPPIRDPLLHRLAHPDDRRPGAHGLRRRAVAGELGRRVEGQVPAPVVGAEEHAVALRVAVGAPVEQRVVEARDVGVLTDHNDEGRRPTGKILASQA
jgi:hypothetical protein